MKILLISSSYIENNLITHMGFLTGDKITLLYLMEENHKSTEIDFLLKCEDLMYGVFLQNDLETAVKSSDKIIFIDDYTLPRITIKKISLITERYKKGFVYIDFSRKMKNKINRNNEIKDKPVILVSNFDYSCEHIKSELNILKKMKEKNINLFYSLSNEVEIILRDFDKIFNLQLCSSQRFDCSLISIVHFQKNGIDFRDKNLELCNKIKPNFLILNCESRFKDYKELVNIYHYKYNLDIDLVINSNYFTYMDNDIYFNIFDFNYQNISENAFENSRTVVLNRNDGEQLMKEILDKITLPLHYYYID